MNKLNVTSLRLCSIFSVLVFISISQACTVRSKCSTLQVHSTSISIRCYFMLAELLTLVFSVFVYVSLYPKDLLNPFSTTASKPLLYLYVSKDLPNSISQYILSVVHYRLIHLSIFIGCQLGFSLYMTQSCLCFYLYQMLAEFLCIIISVSVFRFHLCPSLYPKIS